MFADSDEMHANSRNNIYKESPNVLILPSLIPIISLPSCIVS